MADEFDRYFERMSQMNKESAKTQMEFQERMSSTAHQRETKDLIAAGLNPVLSANNGASSPMGAYANVDNSAISAKFARQNLERELANQRTIAAMNNENAMNIALKQLGVQYSLGLLSNETALKQTAMNNQNALDLKNLDINNPNTFIQALIRFFQGTGKNIAGTDSAKGIGSAFIDLITKGGQYRNVPDMLKVNSAAAGESINKWYNYHKQVSRVATQATRAYKFALQDGKTKQQARDEAAKIYKINGMNVPKRYSTN